jgi:hypothetical protein
MNESKFLLTYLDKYHKIQCSNIKTDKYTFKKAEEALEFNFIRFGNSYFIPAISIDIDFKSDIYRIIYDNNLPEPTFVVHTDRGTHIHWFLEVPISTANKFQLNYLNNLINYLQGLFGGDKYATTRSAGRIWRNPIKFPHIFSGNLVSFSEFTLPKKEKVQQIDTQYTSRNKYKKILNIDFTSVIEGTRHHTLFEYGRAYAYTTGITNPHAEIEAKNALMPNPLSTIEVKSIGNSIDKFMTTKYKKSTYNSSQKTVEFNRKIAKVQSDKKLTEIVNKILISISPITLAKNLTARKAAKVLNISKNTWTKYAKVLISSIKESLLTIKAPLRYLPISTNLYVERSIPMYNTIYSSSIVLNNST